ncbi:MAG: tyrosine--tRNA ligase [Proteobacteria bacterium]|nr:tyrosine--tRNA ligase [Pseudomonadota bacterium]
MKSEFLNILEARGFIHQATNLGGLDAYLAKTPDAKAYIGFDCTAPSLHVGSLVQIMMLRHFQKCGHQPIVLMGGGTTRVGDPSGKTESRKLLSAEDIKQNIKGIEKNFINLLNVSKQRQHIYLNNDGWLKDLNYINFLRDVGRHFTINKMLTMDSVKLRLEREQPLTFLEFNYMILQAYDFVKLFEDEGCRIQLGGSDQWGNIVNGIDLGRRMLGAELFGLTSPLITTSDGEKMGKTAKGAVWLSPDQLSDYDYWQFWRNAQDEDVGRFLRFFTDLPLNEIEKLEVLEGQELNAAKKALANEATALCRGKAAAIAVSATAIKTFEEGKSGPDLPTIEVSVARLKKGVPILDLYVEAGLCSSKKEARRLIQQGGARLNDGIISDENLLVNTAMLGPNNALKLSAGKKRHALVKLR